MLYLLLHQSCCAQVHFMESVGSEGLSGVIASSSYLRGSTSSLLFIDAKQGSCTGYLLCRLRLRTSRRKSVDSQSLRIKLAESGLRDVERWRIDPQMCSLPQMRIWQLTLDVASS